MGRRPVLFMETPQQPLGRLCVPARLEEPLEHESMLVDRAPEPEAPAADCDLDLVEMPDPARARLPAPKSTGDHGTELPNPAAQALVGDLDPALERQFLDGAQAEREAKVEPDGVGDERRREAMALVAGGGLGHRLRLLGRDLAASGSAVNVTAPRNYTSLTDATLPLRGSPKLTIPPGAIMVDLGTVGCVYVEPIFYASSCVLIPISLLDFKARRKLRMKDAILRRGTHAAAARVLALAGAVSLGWLAPPLAQAQSDDDAGWVTAWATSMQDPLPHGFPAGNPALDSPEWAAMFPENLAGRPDVPADRAASGRRRAGEAALLEPSRRHAGDAQERHPGTSGRGPPSRARLGDGGDLRRRERGDDGARR